MKFNKVLLGSLTLVGSLFISHAVLADSIDPQTPQKPGYYITASDEFNGKDLNTNIFNKRYLPHWTDKDTSATYAVNDGKLQLKINKETQPWDPAFDGQTVVSGIQTAERDWLHKWTDYPNINHHEDTNLNHIQKYGYFEIRAKIQKGSGIHSAWWMIGAQQDTNPGSKENGEIDIFEILGKEPNNIYYTWHKWGSDLNDEGQTYNTNQDLSADYHVYGFEWTPTNMNLYLDGKLIKTMNKSPNYPMLTLLGLYEKRAGGWTGAFDPNVPYPKAFDVDYWRAYQKIPTLPYTVNVADFKLYGDSHVIKNDANTRLASLAHDQKDAQQNIIKYDQLYSPDNATHKLTLSYQASNQAQTLTYRVNGGELQTLNLAANQTQVNFDAQLKQGINSIEFVNHNDQNLVLQDLVVG